MKPVCFLLKAVVEGGVFFSINIVGKMGSQSSFFQAALHKSVIRKNILRCTKVFNIIMIEPVETEFLRTGRQRAQLLCPIVFFTICYYKWKAAEGWICFQIPFPQIHSQSKVSIRICSVDDQVSCRLKGGSKPIISVFLFYIRTGEIIYRLYRGR